MKKYILVFLAILVWVLYWGATANAMTDEEFDYLYIKDRICFVNSSYDYHNEQVAVTEFEIREGFIWGSTSLSGMPCAPLACPDGTFMVSDNICSFTDPFAHLPVINDGATVNVEASRMATLPETGMKMTFAIFGGSLFIAGLFLWVIAKSGPSTSQR